MIEPTVGRVVWYWEEPNQKQPMKADIARINSDGTINIGGLNEFGYHFARQSIPLWQGDGDKPKGRYCEWMPYQKGQAAKTEQLRKGIEEMKDENAVEKEIQSKGLNAPRLSPTIISETIIDEAYYVFPGTTLTICCLTLRNGFNVTGESAAASPENFDEQIGRRIAKDNARNKIWALEGYLLKQSLWANSQQTSKR